MIFGSLFWCVLSRCHKDGGIFGANQGIQDKWETRLDDVDDLNKVK